jgi:hypothetical protein
MARSIQVIDLAPFRSGTDKASVVRAVSHACETIGFLVVGGHGVLQVTIDALVDASSCFFALPLAEKEKTISADPQIRRGYSRMESLSLAKAIGVDTPPDLREAYSRCRSPRRLASIRRPTCARLTRSTAFTIISRRISTRRRRASYSRPISGRQTYRRSGRRSRPITLRLRRSPPTSCAFSRSRSTCRSISSTTRSTSTSPT